MNTEAKKTGRVANNYDAVDRGRASSVFTLIAKSWRSLTRPSSPPFESPIALPLKSCRTTATILGTRTFHACGRQKQALLGPLGPPRVEFRQTCAELNCFNDRFYSTLVDASRSTGCSY